MKQHLIPLTVAIASLCLWPADRAQAAGLDPEKSLRPGQPAPDTAGKDLENKAMKLSEFRGKVVVLVFWNSADTCKLIVPQHKALEGRLMGKPFVFLGVNGDRERGDGRKFARKEGITYRTWQDGPKGPLAQAWGVVGYPVIYVVDATGVIRGREAYGQALDKLVDKLLVEMTKPPGKR
ncbi:MAG: TlpA family protein disulfide reductase [Verrucomicrobia bacterium]|nr:TlpA family protein disulfide reductase [Verrucomicrobiota bacterium]